MTDIIKEVGIKRCILYGVGSLWNFLFKFIFLSPMRIGFLKAIGVKIGNGTVIEEIQFINWHHKGFSNLKIGKKCFLGTNTIIDLADKIVIEDEVTIAQNVTILTHMNVGYKDHPLQKIYPSLKQPTCIKKGAFIGAGVIVLPGVVIGEFSLIAAGSIVRENIPPYTLVAGIPAKCIKKFDL